NRHRVDVVHGIPCISTEHDDVRTFLQCNLSNPLERLQEQLKILGQAILTRLAEFCTRDAMHVSEFEELHWMNGLMISVRVETNAVSVRTRKNSLTSRHP